MTHTMEIINTLAMDSQVYLLRSNQKGRTMQGISKTDKYTIDNWLNNYQMVEGSKRDAEMTQLWIIRGAVTMSKSEKRECRRGFHRRHRC